MIWNNCKAEIKILKTDQGYIVEWEVEKPKSQYQSIGAGDYEYVGNPRGIKTFPQLKAALDFIKSKL